MRPHLGQRLADWLRLPQGGSLVAAAPSLGIRVLIRRFAPYLRPLRGLLLLSLVIIVVAPVLDAADVWLFKLVVDRVLVPRDLGAFPPIAVAYVILTVLTGALNILDDLVSVSLSQRFVHRLRTDVFSHLQHLGPEYLERHRVGDLITRLSGDVSAIETLLVGTLQSLVSRVSRILIYGGLLFYLNWQLALVALVGAPAFLLVSRGFSRRIKAASRERRRRSGSLSAAAEQSLHASRLVAAYGVEDDEARTYARHSRTAVAAETASARLRAIYSPIVDLLELAAVLLVLGVGAYELTQGRLSLGGLLVFVAYLGQLNSPVRGLGSMSNSIFSAAAGAERLAELLDAEPTVRTAPDALVPDHVSGDLRLDHVSYAYPGATEPALRDVSLEVHPGEVVAVMGESGSGKSTLVALLLRFADPTSGVIRLDGHDLRDLDLPWLRRQMAISLQEAPLLEGTVESNLRIGRPAATGDQLRRALRTAVADRFVNEMDRGLDSPVGQRGRRLSGGQQGRIGVARAVLREAPLLVLDEPTSGLDADTGEELLARLLGHVRSAGGTTLLVTHDARVARLADRVVRMSHGAVVADTAPGPPSRSGGRVPTQGMHRA